MTNDEIAAMLKPFAVKHDLYKLILFGSRAQGCHSDRSDIDIVAVGGNFIAFKYEVQDKARTLLMFDIVDYNRISQRLREEIDTYGQLIYQKA